MRHYVLTVVSPLRRRRCCRRCCCRPDEQFTKIVEKVEKDTKKAEKLEQKLVVTTKGYRERAAKLRDAVVQHYDGFDEACLDLAAFQV